MVEQGGDDPHGDPRRVAGDPPDGPGVVMARRVGLAARLATELCDLSPGVWRRRAVGSVSSQVAYVNDDPELADVIAEAWGTVQTQPAGEWVRTRTGGFGAVVVTHGDWWSLIARTGGPVLVLSDRVRGVLRVDQDPSWREELTELVAELANVGRGLPPFDESRLPPVPMLPWRHRD
ncbi:MAG: hypothetical protein HY241_01945 [Actinobacteria bacterium]|nr:hypothetical protein [Actinomycetota bacterium]